MIIKSMSRKNMSFLKLLKYLEKEKIKSRFSWNLYSNINNRKEIIKEFMANANYIKNSRGKVFLYHEILSLENNNLSLKEQQIILENLTKQYINKRANNHLVYGVIHEDTNNLHMHLMISSNKICQNKRTRLSKREFKNIQSSLENYKNQTYPQLEQTKIYQNVKDYTKSKQKEQEIKHRRNKQTKKEFLKENLQNIFTRSLSKTALENSLKNNGFYLYKKGVNYSIKYENNNYRLKTLGLDSLYLQTTSKFIKIEQRKEKRKSLKDEKSKSKSNDFLYQR